MKVRSSRLFCGKTYYWESDTEHDRVLKAISSHKSVCPRCKSAQAAIRESQLRHDHQVEIRAALADRERKMADPDPSYVVIICSSDEDGSVIYTPRFGADTYANCASYTECFKDDVRGDCWFEISKLNNTGEVSAFSQDLQKGSGTRLDLTLVCQ